MDRKLIVCVLILAFISKAHAQQTGSAILKQMYDRYAGKWYHNLAFDQKTEVYRNDSLIRDQKWYEVMSFPDKLRIDIMPLGNHNTYIFRSDSTYVIKAGAVKFKSSDGNDLIFLLGGMYTMPYDDVLKEFKKLNYDVGKSYEDTWKGRPVYVIGVSSKNDNVNQVWIDKENMYLVRMIENNDKLKMEGIFDDHLRIGGGFTETKATFYFNGKLAQVETYSNCKVLNNLDDKIFDPYQYVSLRQ
ncbi:MAG TPA: hypothetical protein VHE59_11090 [Mucilaginibacter sp.]|nr:hypothetical protein [Mucilaginibacter sp.]